MIFRHTDIPSRARRTPIGGRVTPHSARSARTGRRCGRGTVYARTRAHALGHRGCACTWDARVQRYTALLEDVMFKACRTVSAKVVLGAKGGYYQQPRIPEDLPGLETFLGDDWHSAVWRHGVSLAGKRAGVIGNGCSV